MKYKKYYICNKEGKSNCIIRSFCKLYNEKYDNVFNELCEIAKDLKCESFNDIEVFEEYMKKRNTNHLEYGKDIKVKDLVLDKGSYIVFCYDKKDFYHMITIINDTIYDKNDDCLELYTITLYKKEK